MHQSAILYLCSDVSVLLMETKRAKADSCPQHLLCKTKWGLTQSYTIIRNPTSVLATPHCITLLSSHPNLTRRASAGSKLEIQGHSSKAQAQRLEGSVPIALGQLRLQGILWVHTCQTLSTCQGTHAGKNTTTCSKTSCGIHFSSARITRWALSSIQPSSGMVSLWDYTIIIYHRVLKKAKPPISPRVCCSKAMQPENSPQPASWKHLTIHRVVKQRQRSCLVTFLTACFKGLPGTNTSCLWTQLERKHHIKCEINLKEMPQRLANRASLQIVRDSSPCSSGHLSKMCMLSMLCKNV